MSVLLFSGAVLKRDLHEWYSVRVALLFAFKFQQVVVSAARSVRKLAAHQRPRVIDGALPRVLIQKCAGLSKQPISFAPENSVFSKHLGKPLGRDFR